MINKLNSKRRAGFTLVEIMIVVAIIALLAAISVPYFLRNREFAQASLVKNDLRLIAAANQEWATENNEPATATATAVQLASYLDKNTVLGANFLAGKAVSSVPSVAITLPLNVASAPQATGVGVALPDVPATYFAPYTTDAVGVANN